MKESAVAWLLSMLDYNQQMLGIKEIIEQAKEIEKEQVIDAYKTSYISMMTAEQYYNKTFKNTDK